MAGCPPQVALRRGLGHFTYMTTSTPNVVVVEIDDMYWRHQKYRCRRNSRAFIMVVRMLGASTLRLISSAAFANTSEAKQAAAFRGMFITAKQTGGLATDPDEFEAAADELMAFSPANGGEGLSYSTSPLGENDAGWVPVRGMVTLDSFRKLDYATTIALLWEIVKVEFRPISAESGTAEGTDPATSTSPKSQTTAKTSSSGPNTTSTGSPPSSTQVATGITIDS